MAIFKRLFARAWTRVAAAGAVALCAVALASCNFGFDENSFQNKAAAYFKEMTSTAAISVYQIAPDDYVNNSAGVPCLPCTGDHTVTFILRNPQKYTFDKGSNMDLGLGDFAEYWGVEIVQDPSDTSKITVTYSEQFLREYGMGTDVSPKVTLYHPVSHSNFGLYDKLAISSDNPPPTPSGAVCMQSDENPSKWVLCFDLPKTPLIKALHQDITSIDINGHTFGVSVDAGGNISYAGGSELVSARPIGLYANQNTGQSFTSAGQAAYFVTGDKADETEKVYQITVTDKAGLSSSLNVSARGFKLGAPKAYQTDDSSYANPFMTVLATKNAVGQEEDGSAHITIHAEAMTASVSFTDKSGAEKTITPEPYDPSDAYILYEVYTEYDSSTNEFSNLVGSGKIKGLTGKVTIPGGTSYVRAYVQKPLYSDSDAIVWNCRAVCTNYFVSAIGGDDNAAGSKAAPLATIAKAVQKFEYGIDVENDYEGTSGAILTVQVMSDITQTGGVSWDRSDPDDPVLKINGYGGTRTVDYQNSGEALLIQSGTVKASGIKFARCSNAAVQINTGATFECQDCAFEDCYNQMNSGGAILNSNGTLKATNCSFERCECKLDNGSGGAIVNAGASASATITGCTFKSCRSDYGAAIGNTGYLLLGACTITENTSGYEHGGALLHKGPSFSLMGGVSYILGNKDSTGNACDICLDWITASQIRPIFIGGVLTGSQIGVYVPFEDTNKPTAGTPKGFTSGYSNENSETKPGVIFKTNTDYSVSTDGGSGIFEAAFAVNGGSMYNAYDYTITFAAADSVPTGMYPGETVTFAVKPTILRAEQTGDPTPLFINPANNKLYTGHTGGTYTGPAGDAAVTITANLYSGSGPAASNMSCAVSYNSTESKEYVTVTIPGQTYPDSYTLKITASYLGRSHTASYSIACNRSAEIVAQAIGRIPNPATVTEYTFVVEGAVGPGVDNADGKETTITSTDEGLAKVAKAIRSKNGTNVRINLDATATSTTDDGSEDYIANYNDGMYFKNCAALKSIKLPDWMEYVIHDLFNGCSSLDSVALCSNTQWIGPDAFNGCSSLASITLPAGITGASSDHHLHGIEAGAFVGCNGGSPIAITYGGTKEQWKNVVRSAQSGSGAEADDWHSGAKDNRENAGNVHCVADNSDCGLDYKPLFTYVGSKTPSETKAVGDVVFTDGSAEPFVVGTTTLSDPQKDAAIAVIFYVGSGLNSGGDTSVRALGVGLKQGKGSWAYESRNGGKTNISSIAVSSAGGSSPNWLFSGDLNGSDNFESLRAELGANDDTESNKNAYSAFWKTKEYYDLESKIVGTSFQDGWYLPSVAELCAVYNNRVLVDEISAQCGGDSFIISDESGVSSCYWSSSEYTSTTSMALAFKFSNGDYKMLQKKTSYNVRAIREF